LTMAAGAIIAFLGVAMLSRLLIVPMAGVLGAVLELVLRVTRFSGRVRDRIPVLGSLVKRIGYGLTLGYVWIGAITALLVLGTLIGGISAGKLIGAAIVLAIGGGLFTLLW